MIHFQLIFIYGVMYELRLIFKIDIQLFQYNLKTIFPPQNYLGLVKDLAY